MYAYEKNERRQMKEASAEPETVHMTNWQLGTVADTVEHVAEDATVAEGSPTSVNHIHGPQ